MSHYCKHCKVLHHQDELCPRHLAQLKQNPSLLVEAANFTNIAGQYHLITSQTLNKAAQAVNKLAGSNLRYEGTQQFIRDIQVFNQLNVDAYSKSGVFSSAEAAKSYMDQATEGQLRQLSRKLTGTGQEVDWLRFKEGKLSSIFRKSELLGGNAPGVDGATINRFTGEQISRTTVKAAQGTKGLGTNVSDVLKALEAGTISPKDIVSGIEGTEDAIKKALEKNIEKAINSSDIDYANKLKQAQEHLKVQELNNTELVKESTNRLTDKIAEGQAHSHVSSQEVLKKVTQGAVIGAVVGLTTSGITSYIKFKNGEITEKDAFEAIGQDTLKGSLIGATMAKLKVRMFLPAGTVGFLAGMVIGIYLDKALTNMLDEAFGKGAYLEILHSSGFIYGMTTNLEDSIKKIAEDEIKITSNERKIKKQTKMINQNFDEFHSLMKEDL